MKGKVTVEEMTKYLKKCKNNVSPGSSGFTNDFYKFFWRDIKILDHPGRVTLKTKELFFSLPL